MLSLAATTPQRSCSSDALLSLDADSLRFPQKVCPGSSSSTSSSHRDRSSFGLAFRHSLGTLSERGEGGAGVADVGRGTGEIDRDGGGDVDGGSEDEAGDEREAYMSMEGVRAAGYENAIDLDFR